MEKNELSQDFWPQWISLAIQKIKGVGALQTASAFFKHLSRANVKTAGSPFPKYCCQILWRPLPAFSPPFPPPLEMS